MDFLWIFLDFTLLNKSHIPRSLWDHLLNSLKLLSFDWEDLWLTPFTCAVLHSTSWAIDGMLWLTPCDLFKSPFVWMNSHNLMNHVRSLWGCNKTIVSYTHSFFSRPHFSVSFWIKCSLRSSPNIGMVFNLEGLQFSKPSSPASFYCLTALPTIYLCPLIFYYKCQDITRWKF